MMSVLYHPSGHGTSGITCKMRIDQLLHLHPEVVPVFISHHVHCVGCPFARFHTVGDVIRFYHLEPDQFIREIYATIAGNSHDYSE